MTYRIHRSVDAGATVFALSGEVDCEHALRLQELLAAEKRGRILLDLKDVTLVDWEAVRFLARAEAAGVGIVNCPEYVRSWMAAENARS